MRAEYQRLTGALPGEDSDIGIRMALLANQLELLEEELGALRQAADPETAKGEMLDRHADSRGLRRKEAAAAGGVLRFLTGRGRRLRRSCCPRDWWPPQPARTGSGLSPLPRDASPPGRLKPWLPAQAEQPGSTGNAAAGSITVLVTAAGSGGRGGDPRGLLRADRTPKLTTELRSRLLESYHAWYPMAPMPPVTAVWPWPRTGWASVRVIQRPRGSGSVDLVIAGEGAVAFRGSTVRELGELVAQQRELGVDAQVTAAEESPCPVTLELFAGENYAFDDVKTQAEAAPSGHCSGNWQWASPSTLPGSSAR